MWTTVREKKRFLDLRIDLSIVYSETIEDRWVRVLTQTDPLTAKNKHSFGPDGYSSDFIKHLANSISLPLTLLFATLFTTGTVPVVNWHSALHAWFTRNGLALNGNKSEAVLFGMRQRLRAFPPIQSVSIAGCQVLLSQTLTVLGARSP